MKTKAFLAYRVEDEDGNGPWHSSHGDLEQIPDELYDRNADNQPPPDVDFNMFDVMRLTDSRYIFGLKAERDIVVWFDDYERRFLQHHGFVIHVYEVTDVIVGRHQVAWLRHHGHRVGSIDWP